MRIETKDKRRSHLKKFSLSFLDEKVVGDERR